MLLINLDPPLGGIAPHRGNRPSVPGSRRLDTLTISLMEIPYTLYRPTNEERPGVKNPLSKITDRIAPPKHSRIDKAIKVTAGTAAALWVVLKLRRELYGPGGTRMSRYDNTVDEVWKD